MVDLTRKSVREDEIPIGCRPLVKNTRRSSMQSLPEFLIGKMPPHRRDICVETVLHEVHKEPVFVANQFLRRLKPVYPQGDLSELFIHVHKQLRSC